MTDPMLTPPFRADGSWVVDADLRKIALTNSHTLRASAIAHALNRLPEAEAEIAALKADNERLRAAMPDWRDLPCKPLCALIGGYGYCSCGMEAKREVCAALTAENARLRDAPAAAEAHHAARVADMIEAAND